MNQKVEGSGTCTETFPVSLSGEPHRRWCFQGVCTKLRASVAIYRLPPKGLLEAISDFLHVHVLSRPVPGMGVQIRHLGKGAFLTPPLARPGQPPPIYLPLDHGRAAPQNA